MYSLELDSFPNLSFIVGQLINYGHFCSICELTNKVSYIHRLSNENSTTMQHSHVLHSQMTPFPADQLSSEFILQRQEDASLFMTTLLDHCARCLNFSTINNSKFQPSDTVIDQIFGVKLLSTVECLSCSTLSEKEETLYLLSLEVNNLFSLTEALEHFFQAELLSGSNAYHCFKCNQLVDAQKSLTIQQLSPILILSFKRSVSDGSRTRKIMHSIDYDESLDVSSYTNLQQFANNSNQNHRDIQSFHYKLYGVIIHSGGNTEEGHFFAYLRTSQDTWFKVDDEHYRKVALTEVLNNQSAFILFYAQSSKLQIGTHILSHPQKPSPILSQNDPFSNDVLSNDVLVKKSYPKLQVFLKLLILLE